MYTNPVVHPQNMTSSYQAGGKTNSRPVSAPGGTIPYSNVGKDTESSDLENPAHTQMTHGISVRFPGQCAECGLRINQIADACHAMGYLYHNSCFVCCLCRRTLCGKVFYKDQDKIYCEEDYLYCGFQHEAEKCSSCGHVISETVLKAMGKAYHPQCFTCTICSKSLNGEPFTVDSENAIYCLPDYHLLHAPQCAACGLIILPKNSSNEILRVSAMNKEFHPECYHCADCRKTLSDEVENRCYPQIDSDPIAPDRTIQRLLCLSCHLSRIGAVPATTVNSMQTSLKPINTTSSPNLRFYPVALKYQGGHMSKPN